MEVLCWAMANPIFQGAGAIPNMYSMLTHKQNIVPVAGFVPVGGTFCTCAGDLLVLTTHSKDGWVHVPRTWSARWGQEGQGGLRI
jgi:hypothetical protein